MQTEDPARMACWQDISAIPVKKQGQPDIGHLTVEQARRLLAQPDRSTRQGRRDAPLLATLYDTGVRVSELAGLAIRDIRLEKPAMASLTGKGRKTRHVPLTGNTITLLAAYLAEHRLDQPGRDGHPLFYGQHRDKLTRGGIAWIIRAVLAACDRESAGGRRDYAILLVMARLALRGGEVAGLDLGDVDWRAGEVTTSTTRPASSPPSSPWPTWTPSPSARSSPTRRRPGQQRRHPQQPAGRHPLPVPLRRPECTRPDGHHQPRAAIQAKRTATTIVSYLASPSST